MFCKTGVLRNFAKLKIYFCNFIKTETLAQVFSCEVCKISKNTFLTEHLRWLLLNISLKLVPAIFYQIWIFSPNASPSKAMKNVFLFHLKSSFRSRDIQIFIIFSLPFHTFQIQKGKWKCNNL